VPLKFALLGAIPAPSVWIKEVEMKGIWVTAGVTTAVFAAGVADLARADTGLRWEASGGVCKLGLAPSGIWWDKRYEHDVDVASGCFQLGVSAAPWRWRGWDFGWRAAYVDLGKFSANSIAPSRDEDMDRQPDGSNCDRNTWKDCVTRFDGHGHAYGVSLGGLVEKRVGKVTLGIEAGAYVYYSYYMVTTTHQYGYSEVWDRAKGVMVTPYIGVTAQHGHLMTAARVYSSIREQGDCGGCCGLTRGPAVQWTVGVSF
jgi:hypothetical protein